MHERGKLIVVAGPSGAGKGTLEARLMEKYPQIQFSVSVTTRPPRDYEVDGIHYFFIDQPSFIKKIQKNELVEWQEVYNKNGHLYGTLRSFVEDALSSGKILLIDIDIKGGLNVKAQYPEDTVSIFIRPPSKDALLERLKRRGTDSPEQIQIRLERMPEEVALGEHFDEQIINDDLEEATRQMITIVEKKCQQLLAKKMENT
ncbi:MAG: guanylate kinase [Candidatus Marinimicrobia bacterium]|nr:guanylate kinase [Candidatus Neomarinimicrobiota bacterium]MCF7839172.1 guanylate kinase [Candidatus Neomarinimicrobiota bacterium]